MRLLKVETTLGQKHAFFLNFKYKYCIKLFRYRPNISSKHLSVVFKNSPIAEHFEAWFPSALKGIILVHGLLSWVSFSLNTASISFDPRITGENLNPHAFEVPTGNVNH